MATDDTHFHVPARDAMQRIFIAFSTTAVIASAASAQGIPASDFGGHVPPVVVDAGASLIDGFDGSAVTPKPPGRRGRTTLRQIEIPAARVRSVAAAAGLKYRDTPGVTITPDAARGRLIVMAPPAIHGRIQTTVEELMRGGGGRAQTERFVLRYLAPEQFESILTGVGPSLSRTTRGASTSVWDLTPLGMPATSASIERTPNDGVAAASAGIVITAPAEQIEAWRRLMRWIDSRRLSGGEAIAMVPITNAGPAPVQRAIRLIGRAARDAATRVATAPDDGRTAKRLPATDSPFRAAGYRPGSIQARTVQDREASDAADGNDADNTETIEGGAGVLGDVQIEFVPELGQVIVRGSQRDIDRVKDVIRQIEEQSEITKPDVEVVPLQNVDSNALATLLKQIYDDVLSARQGQISITALDNPNALLLIGRTEAIRDLRDLIAKLDVPSGDTDRLRVYRLRHAAASDAETVVRDFFTNRPGSDEDNRPALGTRVRIRADYRTNSLIVSASPRDLDEVTRLVDELDVADIPTETQLQVFPLSNSRAEELAPIIQDAISGGDQADEGDATTPSSTLSIGDDTRGGNIRSGIVAAATVTPDPNANALVVRAPAGSMDLIGELIRQLDQAPGFESLVKVFTIENGDASQLVQALQNLFGTDAANTGTGGVGGGNVPPSSTAGSDTTLTPLRFTVDARTNSIIAAGSADDLDVVESILLRLDTVGFAERITEVIWLRHQSAVDIATALQTYVQQRQQGTFQIQQFQQGLGPFDLGDRDLIVVPEPVTNSVLISVAPRLYEDVRRLVDQLDRRPPMVLIKTVIAEVTLSDGFEIGGELGLQDSLLFDRGIAGAAIDIPDAPNNNGFNFNTSGTPNEVAFGRENVAGRGISTFGLGTVSPTFGYGGFVLSAANESVSLLFRTLQDADRLQILSRPQVMTMDNTDGFVQVGRQVARINNVIPSGIQGFTVSTEDVDVGLILRVRPRVGSDGLIIMSIDATRSERDQANGTPIPTGDGSVVVIDDIIRTTAQSVIAAYSGQTVVFGGLIQKSRVVQSRRTPYLADIPLVGTFFRFDRETERRSELLVLMTPHLVTAEEDLEYIKQVESSRMSWCLADVVEMHGDVGLSGGYGLWGPAVGPTIYPDMHPTVDQFISAANACGDAATCVDPATGGVVYDGVPVPLHPSLGGMPAEDVIVRPGYDGPAYPGGGYVPGADPYPYDPSLYVDPKLPGDGPYPSTAPRLPPDTNRPPSNFNPAGYRGGVNVQTASAKDAGMIE